MKRRKQWNELHWDVSVLTLCSPSVLPFNSTNARWNFFLWGDTKSDYILIAKTNPAIVKEIRYANKVHNLCYKSLMHRNRKNLNKRRHTPQSPNTFKFAPCSVSNTAKRATQTVSPIASLPVSPSAQKSHSGPRNCPKPSQAGSLTPMSSWLEEISSEPPTRESNLWKLWA